MKLLHVSDLHYHKQWFTWVAKQAKSYDCVCVTGDFLDTGDSAAAPLEDQIHWVLNWLQRFPGRLTACSGNHDCSPASSGTGYRDAEAQWLQQARRKNVMVDGDVELLGGWRFACAGWARPIVVDDSGPTILLWHAPPQALAVSTTRAGEDWGNFDATLVAEQLASGSLILSGHVHEPRRWYDRIAEVSCFNPGRAHPAAAIPNHIVIDSTKRLAVLQTPKRIHGPVRI